MKDLTLGQLGKALVRYQPFIATIVAVVLIIVVLPGRGGGNERRAVAGPGPQAPATQPTTPGGTPVPTVTTRSGGAAPAAPAAPTPSGQAAAAPGGAARPAGPAAGGTTVSTVPASTAPGDTAPPDVAATLPNPDDQSAAPAPGLPPNCDTSRGKLKIPSIYAADCIAVFAGDNGGATYQGVTAEEIVVVVYNAMDDPATSAILTAAGADDSDEQFEATTRAYFAMYSDLFESYGRTVKLVFVNGSGETDDDAAAKADAIAVATEHRAFASLFAPSSTAYVDELVARGVVCFCTVSLPVTFYLDRDPYVISPGLMASHQGYIHRAEYIGKKLARRTAEHAGDPVIALKERAFGIIYYETANNAYQAGIDFFEQELRKYDVTLTDRVAYIFEVAQAQEQARTVIGRFVEKGVTSVVFAGDPIYPIFFTQEATRQNYNPEWIITGSALTDTSFFARLYDKTQWSNAFGVSYLAARVPQVEGDAYRLHQWYFGTTPEADDTYFVIAPTYAAFMTAVHRSGPTLNPTTLRDGLFTAPAAGGAYRGGLTSIGVSYGTDKGIWPWADHLAADDTTEIWWDPVAAGEDELGTHGAGLYQYVDGGKRYLPGQWTSEPTKAFQPRSGYHDLSHDAGK